VCAEAYWVAWALAAAAAAIAALIVFHALMTVPDQLYWRLRAVKPQRTQRVVLLLLRKRRKEVRKQVFAANQLRGRLTQHKPLPHLRRFVCKQKWRNFCCGGFPRTVFSLSVCLSTDLVVCASRCPGYWYISFLLKLNLVYHRSLRSHACALLSPAPRCNNKLISAPPPPHITPMKISIWYLVKLLFSPSSKTL